VHAFETGGVRAQAPQLTAGQQPQRSGGVTKRPVRRDIANAHGSRRRLPAFAVEPAQAGVRCGPQAAAGIAFHARNQPRAQAVAAAEVA